jgi:hypothetical protein
VFLIVEKLILNLMSLSKLSSVALSVPCSTGSIEVDIELGSIVASTVRTGGGGGLIDLNDFPPLPTVRKEVQNLVTNFTASFYRKIPALLLLNNTDIFYGYRFFLLYPLIPIFLYYAIPKCRSYILFKQLDWSVF